MRTNIAGVALGFSLCLGAGCASVDPSPSFDEAARLASERVHGEIAWPKTREEEQALDRRVAEILASELTPASAVQVALLNNRGLRALYAELGVAQADLAQASLLPNPVLSADVRFGVGVSGTGADLGLVQEVLSLLQVPLRRRVAAAALERATLEVGAGIFELASAVKTASFAVQAAEQRVELRQSVVAATQASADIAERQRAAGNLTDLDAASERALHEEAKLALAEAELEVAAAREALNALLGLWGESIEWSLGKRLPGLPAADVPFAGLESRAVTQRLDLRAAHQRAVEAGHTRSFFGFYGLVPAVGAGVAAERELEGGTWSLGPAIEIEIPLFDQRQAAAASAGARVQQREQEFAALAVQIRADVRRAWVRMAAARERAEHYQAVVLPLRHQIVSETLKEYNAMQVGVYQLLLVKRDEIETGARWIDALHDYWIARVELEAAVGSESLAGGSR